MSNKIGRWVKSDEVIHHKDENKLNNEESNLEILTKEHHNHVHLIKDKRRCLKTGRFLKKTDGKIY